MTSRTQASRVARARLRYLDDLLATSQLPARPPTGWLRTVRETLRMTQRQLGIRLSVSPQAVSSLERQEVGGRITLQTLQRIASALDCEFAYVLVPKSSLGETIARQALRRARDKLAGVQSSQVLAGAALSNEHLARTIDDLSQELGLILPRDLWDTID